MPGGVISIDPTMTFSGAGAGSGTTGTKFSVDPLNKLDLNSVTLPGATAGVYGGGIPIRSNGTVGVGYTSGAGGTVTQSTDKTTGVTLNKMTGLITLNNATLGNAAGASFTLNNSFIKSTDQILVTHDSVGSFADYVCNGRATGAGTGVISVRNVSDGSLSEAIVLRFSIIKSVNA
jgi:hypothetical protein